MRTKWLGLVLLLVAGCNPGSVPPAVQSWLDESPGTRDTGTLRGISETLGTWAYLIIPPARILMDLHARMEPPRPANVPANQLPQGPMLRQPAGAHTATALVGVYTAPGQELILDTSGGFSLEYTENGTVTQEHGRWMLRTDRLVLLPAEHSVQRQLTLVSPEQATGAPALTFSALASDPTPVIPTGEAR